MSNLKKRGEVTITGADGSHTFRLGTGAICTLEETLNVDVMVLFKELQTGTVKLSRVREFVMASSVSEPDMTKERANDVIDDFGVLPIIGAMTESILATFNAQQEKNGNGRPHQAAPARRRKAGAGTSSAQPNRAS